MGKNRQRKEKDTINSIFLLTKKKLNGGSVKELIFALSATMEGDTTAYYLYKKFKGFPVTFSSIARGIAVGDELEYADEISLGRSIVNRRPYNEKS